MPGYKVGVEGGIPFGVPKQKPMVHRSGSTLTGVPVVCGVNSTLTHTRDWEKVTCWRCLARKRRSDDTANT